MKILHLEPSRRPGLQRLGCDRVGDLRLARQHLLHPLQAHLTHLKGVDGETEQCRGKHQPLGVEEQGHKTANAEALGVPQCGGLQPSCTQYQKQQQAEMTDFFQGGEEHGPDLGQRQCRVPVTAIQDAERLTLVGLLTVNFDGADSRQVLLNQVAQLGEMLLLATL